MTEGSECGKQPTRRQYLTHSGSVTGGPPGYWTAVFVSRDGFDTPVVGPGNVWEVGENGE